MAAFLCFIINSVYSQNQPNVVKNLPYLNNLRSLRRSASDTALTYANYVIKTAKSTGDKHLECEANLELGRIYFAKSDQTKALETIVYAESISTPNDNCYYSAPQVIGFILNRQGKAEEGLAYLFKALKKAEDANFTIFISSSYFAIADAYRENKKGNLAFDYTIKGLQIAESIKDTVQIILAYGNLSNILSNRDYVNTKRLDSAIYYQLKIMNPPFNSRSFTPYDSTKHFSNLGRLYRMKQQFDLAKYNLDIALEIANRKDFKSFQQSVLNEIATLELDKGNNEKALALTQKAKDILPASETSLNRVKELVERTQEANAVTGNYEAAFGNLINANKIKDSLFSLKNQAAITEIEKKYERDAKVLKATNLTQKKENERNIVIAASIFLLAIISTIFIWRTYKRKQQNQFLSTLIHEVNHRTKNNLQMLNSLITSIYQNVEDDFIKGEIKKLRSYIKSFGLLYDSLNKAASFDDVNISEYTQDIGKAVLGNTKDGNLEFLYKADSNILMPTDKAILIGLIVNELITNSIKYAFPSSTNNQIAINLFKQKDNMLHIVYEDSGEGYKIDGSSKNSFGLNMIQQLVKQLKGSINFDAINAKRVTIFIPLT